MNLSDTEWANTKTLSLPLRLGFLFLSKVASCTLLSALKTSSNNYFFFATQITFLE